MNSLTQDSHQPAIIFRHNRKRKTLRQRAEDGPSSQEQNQLQRQPLTHSQVHGFEPEPAVGEALRARNSRKPRLQGVGFRADSNSLSNLSTLDREPKLAVAKSMPDRFMHQTGLMATVNDKHMTDYIESRLSSRGAPALAPLRPKPENFTSSTPTPQSRTVQPTQHGKIVEVDLSSHIGHDEDKKRKAGSSLTPPVRRRNRRASDDYKRDQLVEAFLHENKLDVYDVPKQTSSRVPGDRRSADDRMAEEFRHRFFTEAAARRQRRKPIPQSRQQQQLQQLQAREVLKGPKLGGSRNQRAAVRKILLQQEKEKAGIRF